MTSIRQIARDIGASPSTVSRAIRAGRDPATIKPRGKSAPKTDPGKVADIETLARQGLTSGQIADVMGMARRQTVTEIAARHGIVLQQRRQGLGTLRDQVQDMRPVDAVEHLLYILEEILGPDAEVAEAKDRLKMTPTTARIYCALRRAAPRAVSHAQVQLVATARYADPAAPTVVATHISRLRRVLPPDEAIRNVWGLGYKWEQITP